ncbi:putative reverse transcriptase domain-containing protein [Tanacetum coccineum]
MTSSLNTKVQKFEWGDKQEAAFQLLKQKLCSAPILALPEGSEDFIVYCDALIKGLGAVLMQREKDKKGSLDLPKQILNAQTEARKPENIKNEDVGVLGPVLSIHASIKAAPFESLLYWFENVRSLFMVLRVGDVQTHGPEIVRDD